MQSRAARRRAQNNTPMSDDVREAGLADIIGKAVALHVGQILQQMPWQPGCLTCITEAKRAEQEYQVACRNAVAAAEPAPDEPLVGVNSAITIGPAGPVCWQHFDPDHLAFFVPPVPRPEPGE